MCEACILPEFFFYCMHDVQAQICMTREELYQATAKRDTLLAAKSFIGIAIDKLLNLYYMFLQADLVSASDLSKLKALLRHLNTEAEVIPSKESKVSPKTIMGTGKFSLEKAEAAPGWLKVRLNPNMTCIILLGLKPAESL